MLKIKLTSFSEKVGMVGTIFCVITSLSFAWYGITYDYYDAAVMVAFLLGSISSMSYILLNNKISEICNLFASMCISFGMGIFFLNSYPVWADRLNHISMYGSRGTLAPVIMILTLCVVTVFIESVSCFTRKGMN